MPTQNFKSKNEMEVGIKTAATRGFKPYMVYQDTSGQWVVIFFDDPRVKPDQSAEKYWT